MADTDKLVYLPQLQRYDEKLKRWADAKFLTKADMPSLPKATATTLGGVKVGNGLSVTDDGVLSAEDDIVFTWDFDTSAFSCNKTFAEVKKIVTTGVRRTATANGIPEGFSVTLLVGVANDNAVVFFGTAPTDTFGAGMLGSRVDGTITYLFQDGIGIMYTSDGHIQKIDLSNLNTNMSFDFKNTTFQYDQYNSFDLKDGGITSAKIANSAIIAAKLASNAVIAEKIKDGEIVSAKIKDGAITSAKLASGAVTADKIADGAITANKIADGVIDAASSRTIQATGTAPLNLSVESLPDGGSKIKGSLNIGTGLRVEAQHGLLMPSVDNETIGIGPQGLCTLEQDMKILAVETPIQIPAESVLAVAQNSIVFVMFNGVIISTTSKTLVGQITDVNFRPSTKIVGTVLANGDNRIDSAFATVEDDGRIFIEPLYSSFLSWSGTLIYPKI